LIVSGNLSPRRRARGTTNRKTKTQVPPSGATPHSERTRRIPTSRPLLLPRPAGLPGSTRDHSHRYRDRRASSCPARVTRRTVVVPSVAHTDSCSAERRCKYGGPTARSLNEKRAIIRECAGNLRDIPTGFPARTRRPHVNVTKRRPSVPVFVPVVARRPVRRYRTASRSESADDF